MQQTFEHLLGLRAETALAILAGYGVTDVDVVPTEAPGRRVVAEAGMREEPTELETRVVAVRDDGRTLIVSRFRVGDPPDPSPKEQPE